jgi:uncharacterized protein involved in exopolysaccharide biosynthesis
MVFRHRWWLFALPLLTVLAYGTYKAGTQQKLYRASGTLSVSDTSYIAQLSALRTPATSYETVASRLTRDFSGLMTTDQFALNIADRAGLTAAVKSGQFTLNDIRIEVVASASSDSLMQVVGIDTDPGRAAVLVKGAIDSYRAWVLNAELSGSDAAEKFYDGQLAGYQTAIQTADNALTDYLTRHPAPADTSVARDISEQLQIERLNNQLSRAQTQYDSAVNKRDEARLASVQSDADISQRIKVVDDPIVPTSPEGSLKKKATTFVLYGFIGALLGLSLLALMTIMDRTVHSQEDLDWMSIPTLGTVSRDRRATASRSRASPTDHAVSDVAGGPMRAAG